MGRSCSALSLGNKILPVTLAVSALFFLGLGGAFVAPYWIADGASFLAGGVAAFLSVRRFRCGEVGFVVTSRVTCGVALVSIAMDFAFAVTSVLLFNDVMNPWAWTGYGREGSSFIICSLYSACLNTLSFLHFFRLSRAHPAATATATGKHEGNLLTDNVKGDASRARVSPADDREVGSPHGAAKPAESC